MAYIQTWQSRLSPLLSPLGSVYSLLMARRRAAYEGGLRERFAPACPCVSVGNIGWGGTGKTPVVSWLLDWAAGRGMLAVVLTRGYGGRPPKRPFVVTPDADPAQAGDEPLMLARTHTGAMVVADPVRRRSGTWAQARYAPGLFVLDDGFQHLAVQRHVDLVLLRPEDVGSGWGRVIPAGSWREGAAALSRADAFLCKTPDGTLDALAPAICERLGGLGKPVFGFSLRPSGLVRVDGGGARPDLGGEPYLLVSGVGAPEQVAVTAAAFLGRDPAAHLAYADHHAFTAGDWADMAVTAAGLGAAHIVCTPKDAVKLAPFADATLFSFALETVFTGRLFCDTSFPQWWEAAFSRIR